MIEEAIKLTVDGRSFSATRATPDGQESGWTIIYAPGAGSNLSDLFGEYLAIRLAGSGICTVRFQFPYMEEGKRRPDPPRLLEKTWREIIRATRPANGKVLVGGRSMGGRIASQVVAQGEEVDGLALFAYPLHPPSNPENRRDVHLAHISVPTLFCSGTRDSFASVEELKEAASKLAMPAVHHLKGADHSFAVLQSSGRTRLDVWIEAADILLFWLHEI